MIAQRDRRGDGGVAFVATRGGEPTEREVTTVVPGAAERARPSATVTPKPEPKPKPPAVAARQGHVEVYNNSGITGLAGEVAEQATDMGWKVVGSDNWYGTIPTNTVYYPAKLKRAAKRSPSTSGSSARRPPSTRCAATG